MFYKWIFIIPFYEGSPKLFFHAPRYCFVNEHFGKKKRKKLFALFFFTLKEWKIYIFMNQSFVIRAVSASLNSKYKREREKTMELNETIELVFLNFIEGSFNQATQWEIREDIS